MKIFFRNLGQLFQQDQQELNQAHDTKFDQTGERFDHAEQRLDQAEQRLDHAEPRLDAGERRLDSVESRVDAAAADFDEFRQTLEARLTQLEESFQSQLEKQTSTLQRQFEERFTALEQLHEARCNGLDARLDLVERNLEVKAQEAVTQMAQRAQDFEASLQEQFHQLDAVVDERLTHYEVVTAERMNNYEAAVDDRLADYSHALDTRIDGRLQQIELRSDERTVQLTENVHQTFDQRARALDLRADDRLGHLERNLDQRMTNFEKGIDQRLYQREKYMDDLMVKFGDDIVARTDVLLQQSDQRIDKLRRGMRAVLATSAAEGTPTQQLAAFDQLLPPQSGLGEIAAAASTHLQQSPQSEQVLYHQILEWKKTATEALNKFTPDEQEIVDYILSFSPSDKPAATEYARQHLRRFVATLHRIPPPRSTAARVLELGCETHFTPALKKFGGYSQISCANWSELDSGLSEQLTLRQRQGNESLTFEINNFNAERDRFPYPDGHFALVLCCEMLEHLAHDPMHMLWECNRVLEKDGYLLLTTPNLASARSLEGILLSCQPYLLSQYNVQDSASQHHREYTPQEVHDALQAAGFALVALETDDVWAKSNPAVLNLLKQLQFTTDLRGDNIVALARKAGAPVERYPEWLYVGAPSVTTPKPKAAPEKKGKKA